MKGLNYYMNLKYKIEVVKEASVNGYILSIPELKGYIICADDINEGMKLIKDAKKRIL